MTEHNTPTPKDVSELQPIFRLCRKPAKLTDSTPLEGLPQYWQRAITKLCRENAKTRIELRDTRGELAEAQQRIATLLLDIADLRDGIAL